MMYRSVNHSVSCSKDISSIRVELNRLVENTGRKETKVGVTAEDHRRCMSMLLSASAAC